MEILHDYLSIPRINDDIGTEFLHGLVVSLGIDDSNGVKEFHDYFLSATRFRVIE